MKINKTMFLIFVFYFLFCCSPKADKVERLMEDGIEVVLNHLEPYSIPAEKAFSLEKIFFIDTEQDETAEMGLTSISNFDVDSEGKIFLLNRRAKENSVVIFNKEGRFISAFGPLGQGPGEFQNPIHLAISDQDEIVVTDRGKAHVFSNAGDYLNSFPIDLEYHAVIPLNKEKYLVVANKMNEDFSQSYQVILCSSEMEELKVLDSSKIEGFTGESKVNIIPTLLHWEKSNHHIFTGATNEYEIRVFDFDGEPVRKIIKEYKKTILSEETKERYQMQLQRYPPKLKKAFFIPDAYPPFQGIDVLSEKRLFVQTFERSNDGKVIYDVYNAEGVFISRVELEGSRLKFRGDKAYCLKEKDSGFIELAAYRMTWE